VDSGATRNYILPVIIKKKKVLPHRQKKNLYPLVTISGDPILYKNGIIHFKTGPVKIQSNLFSTIQLVQPSIL